MLCCIVSFIILIISLLINLLSGVSGYIPYIGGNCSSKDPYTQIYDDISAVDKTNFDLQRDFANKYSWAIPSRKSIRKISKFILGISDSNLRDTKSNQLQLLSIGAGRGLWEYLLGEYLGDRVKIVATDNNSWELSDSFTYVPVEKIDAVSAAKKYPSDILLTVWPPYNSTMAIDAILHMNPLPKYCIYIGEGIDGCTADDAFHEFLNTEYKLVKTISVENWPHIHDRCFIYEKNESN